MKKTLLSVALALATFGGFAQTAYQTFSATGTATVIPTAGGTKGGGSDTINFTPCTSNSSLYAGAAWTGTKVNFTKCFSLKFKAMFTTGIYGTGGDGICVVFGSNITTGTLPNAGGGYMGYYNDGTVDHDYNHSMAIEFDTYDDCAGSLPLLHDDCLITPGGDHTHVSMDAVTTLRSNIAYINPASTTTTPVTIKDGTFHDYLVQWIPEASGGPLLKVYVDGVERVHNSTDHFGAVGHPFTHPNAVPFGFTAGSALDCSYQEVTDVQLTDSCGGTCCCDGGAGKCSEKCYWRLTGNHTSATDFIGTLNPEDFRIATDNTQRAMIDKIGRTGIHIPGPSTTLDVEGAAVYSGAPSGIRFRKLPPGQGLPLVVDANGYIYVAGKNVNDTTGVDSFHAPNMDQTNQINTMQNQINELQQQLAQLQAQYNIGNFSGRNSLSVTPNPTTSGQATAHYTIGGSYTNASIIVADASGQVVFTVPLSSSSGDAKLSMSNASGQMIVTLVVDDKVSASQKLILLNK